MRLTKLNEKISHAGCFYSFLLSMIVPATIKLAMIDKVPINTKLSVLIFDTLSYNQLISEVFTYGFKSVLIAIENGLLEVSILCKALAVLREVEYLVGVFLETQSIQPPDNKLKIFSIYMLRIHLILQVLKLRD